MYMLTPAITSLKSMAMKMINQTKTLLLILLLLTGATGLHSTVRLHPIFTDHMVVQRNKPLKVWGPGTPGEQLRVSFGKYYRNAQVKSDSTWQVIFPAQHYNITPQTLELKAGQETLRLEDILVGDVWICSGQSNMEFPMMREMHVKAEKKEAAQPLIRFTNPPPAGRYVYGVAYTDSLNRRMNTSDFYRWEQWHRCDSVSFLPLSAVGYYFAKSIVSHIGIPTGIINLAIGGAPIETFISREAMAASPQFAVKVKPGNWLENESLPEWTRTRGRQNVGSNPNGTGDDLGPNHAYKPGFAYEAGIKPLTPLAVKGFLWYQGESNSLEKPRVDEYPDLFRLMVSSYRTAWNNRMMPFYWVQLSSIDTVSYQSRFWPKFRDDQRRVMDDIPHSGMAVCSDIGFRNDVHPTNKKAVGERLARWALAQDYGFRRMPSGPLPTRVTYRQGVLTLTLRYARGLKTSDNGDVRGFSLDGKTECRAIIRNDKIVIFTAEKPEYLYYSWKPFSDANLVNGDDLPASTFRVKVP